MNVARLISRVRSFGFSLVFCAGLGSSAPAQAPPAIEVRSEAPSLEIKYSGRRADELGFSIHNAAQRAVVAFHIKLVYADPTLGAGSAPAGNRESSRPLIAPGGVFGYATREADPRGGPLQAVVLTTAVFDDDTFEGDERSAAAIATRGIGHDGQFERIAPIVSRILADSTLDQDAKIAQIRAEIGKLSEEPDAPTFSRYAHMFPALTDTERPSRSRDYSLLQEGYRMEKYFVLRTLKQFTCGDFPRGTTLEQWWEWTSHNQESAVSPCAQMAFKLSRR